jgi:hypothetical protein
MVWYVGPGCGVPFFLQERRALGNSTDVRLSLLTGFLLVFGRVFSVQACKTVLTDPYYHGLQGLSTSVSIKCRRVCVHSLHCHTGVAKINKTDLSIRFALPLGGLAGAYDAS